MSLSIKNQRSDSLITHYLANESHIPTHTSKLVEFRGQAVINNSFHSLFTMFCPVTIERSNFLECKCRTSSKLKVSLLHVLIIPEAVPS